MEPIPFSVSDTPPEQTFVPTKLELEEQTYTPPSKMIKKCQDQSADGLNVSEANESYKSVVSASSASDTRTPISPVFDAQLQRLNAAFSSRLSSQRKRTRDSVSTLTSNPSVPGSVSEALPESQPNTVGSEGSGERQTPADRTFMLSSNVNKHEEITAAIVSLGGAVSECANPAAAATHLLCVAPGRSEKMLGSMAAGRWILHPAYVARSRAAGRFLDEEEYEWGNPRALCLPVLNDAERKLAHAACRWRMARAAGYAGAFSGIRAVLHVLPAQRPVLTRLLNAGEGIVIDDESPYSSEDVMVCFAEIKRCPLSERDAAWFISRGIPVCPPVVLISYLTDAVAPNPVEHCYPNFRPK